MLSDRLTELQESGLLEHVVDTGTPIAVTCRLTPHGQRLWLAMDALHVWAGAPTDDGGNPVPQELHAHWGF
ncbi:winged helix-turn-helix transcriptional regulator [Streptomyces sp. NPDC052016]|uniref:winged helix-turn-helix transcriptional regulator n=1 Tax=Streptomyces sp. NPDC052016 TaxID=3365680 RepID=UPI0037D153B1